MENIFISYASVSQGLGAQLKTWLLYSRVRSRITSAKYPSLESLMDSSFRGRLRYMRSDREAHFPLSLTTLLSTEYETFKVPIKSK